ncbi:MAG: ATP-binding protein [Hydrogenophilales bacterium 16-64-46]|nr:MAG: ATP-binding protein [Hydrogenophilales bacterium 12-64-13]OYZ06565.1 MAG: ATP-binding protein [Hydrogenophilales bacterium 16-64-46]OZA39273.1 MAG: ATP-binding protein [Hydrogenophilales bacterium 17-64-34]HQS98827.1 PEP-CTERM system histidine kinase PrsK [Thiobacillus sp.]
MPDAQPLLAALGYALAALAYTGLTGLIIAGWKTRPNGRLLGASAALTALWAGALLLPGSLALSPGSVLALEATRNGAWLALLFHILHLRGGGMPLPGPLKILRGLASFLVLTLVLGGLLTPALLASLDWIAPLGLVILAVSGVVLVEQIYRGSRREDRWAIKFLCLGLGALFLYDFYLYAHAALFHAFDAHVWAARGYAATLVAPLIAVSAARNPEWAAPVSLSRSMAFHTASLLGAGVYLLLMAGAGYYLKLFGGDWGDVVRNVFVFAAALLLILLMVSGTLRARLRVFMSKHFFSYRYDYREEWLKFTRTLTEGQSGDHLGERSIEALARLIESPGGALWMRESPTLFQRAAHWNWADLQGSEAADSAFLTWLADKQWVVDLDEIPARRDLYGELEAPAWLRGNRDAWLIVPLMLHDELFGFVVLKHSLAHVAFNWEVSDLLKVAARQAAAHLAQMRASNQLIVARQFESFNRTTTFIIHDLKNLIAQLSLLLANAEKHHDNPEFQADMLETVESAVIRMNKVLAQLRRSGSETLESIALADILRDAVESKRAFKLRPTLDLPPPSLRVRAERERLTRAIGHLVQNALEATPADGTVSVSARGDRGQALIEISDTGSGMDEEFIHTRLFAPFDSTKGAGMGIGAYECRETLRALGGGIEVESRPGAGTRFRLSLPLDTNARQGVIA